MVENQEVAVREEDAFSQLRPGEGLLDFIERQEREEAARKVREMSPAAVRDRLEHFKSRIIYNYSRTDKPKTI